MNRNYLNGRYKEYKIIKELKNEGWDIAQRSAGSHSPIDIFAINKKLRVIKFIQSKPDNFSNKEKEKINLELNYLNNMFRVEFEVR